MQVDERQSLQVPTFLKQDRTKSGASQGRSRLRNSKEMMRSRDKSGASQHHTPQNTETTSAADVSQAWQLDSTSLPPGLSRESGRFLRGRWAEEESGVTLSDFLG